MTFPFRRWTLAALLAVALIPTAAMAQSSKSGFYGSLRGAFAIPTNSKVSEKAGGFTVSSTLEAKSGFAFMAALGYDVSENLGVELEFGYRSFGFSKFKGLDVSGPDGSVSFDGKLPIKGSIKTLSLMANGIFSAKVWEVKPYVGAGIGVARHSGKYDKQTFQIGDEPYTYNGASDTAFSFAYQAIVGVGYPISDGAEIQAGYRYFATSKAKFDDTEATYGSHNFEVGIQFRF